MRKLTSNYKVGDKLYARAFCTLDYFVYTVKEVLNDRYIVFNDFATHQEVADRDINKEMTNRLNSKEGKMIQKYNKEQMKLWEEENEKN